MNINLHIERLVLDGLDIAPEQRPILQAAVERELSRLLTERGLSSDLAQGVAVPRLSASDMQIPVRAAQSNSGNKLRRRLKQPKAKRDVLTNTLNKGRYDADIQSEYLVRLAT